MQLTVYLSAVYISHSPVPHGSWEKPTQLFLNQDLPGILKLPLSRTPRRQGRFFHTQVNHFGWRKMIYMINAYKSRLERFAVA